MRILENIINKFLTKVTFNYAEIHYKFKYSFSLYNMNEPEIIFDAPYRLSPNQSLPISLIIKDAHLFPIDIKEIKILGPNDELLFEFKENIPINKLLFYKIISINSDKLSKYINQKITITPKIKYEINGKIKTAITHNFKQTSHSPLEIFIASENFPLSNKFLWSDLHIHSFFTHDQVEFGAPIEAIAKTAQAIGLNNIAVTDHSYDLDDEMGEYYKPDKNLTRWKNLKKDSEKYSTENLSILFGEEVSCGNKKNQNVHFLVINDEKFIAGNGDSAEKWFKNKPTHLCKKIIETADKNSLLISAHPNEKVPIFQKFLLRRGAWSFSQEKPLNGFQIMNGVVNKRLGKSIKLWTKQLLKGEKLFIYAGNDSHGNFNNFRQIKAPMISLNEKDSQLLGKHRTGIISKNSKSDILKSLKNGKCFITNSFSIDLKIINEFGEIFELGETANGKNLEIKTQCLSNNEFGKIENLKIYFGDLAKQKEEIIFEKNINDFNYSHTLNLQNSGNGYIRAEIKSGKNKKIKIAITNPIWVG
ncbi:MAG: CehA/McbA family metallohydrolase [Candidatus Marinimicrobia bacterium]|nr:CehA/McbA family metallohydrolase [Candidatus Neomarinimicrobiota bacterium]